MQIILKLYLTMYLIFPLGCTVGISRLIDLKQNLWSPHRLSLFPHLSNSTATQLLMPKTRSHPWFYSVPDSFRLLQLDLLSILLLVLCDTMLTCKDYTQGVSPCWLPVGFGQKGASLENQKKWWEWGQSWFLWLLACEAPSSRLFPSMEGHSPNKVNDYKWSFTVPILVTAPPLL